MNMTLEHPLTLLATQHCLKLRQDLCDQADWKRISKGSGKSIFYRLYDLCGFDPVKDFVIDAMHAIVLNLIWTELEVHLLSDLGANADRMPLERDPKIWALPL